MIATDCYIEEPTRVLASCWECGQTKTCTEFIISGSGVACKVCDSCLGKNALLYTGDDNLSLKMPYIGEHSRLERKKKHVVIRDFKSSQRAGVPRGTAKTKVRLRGVERKNHFASRVYSSIFGYDDYD